MKWVSKMTFNSVYVEENFDNSSSYEPVNRDERMFLEKLTLLTQEFDLSSPEIIDDDENIFDKLFIIKTPNSMDFSQKRRIWGKIVDEMLKFSINMELINYYNNNGIILE